jgi:nickel superoxide dismutase
MQAFGKIVIGVAVAGVLVSGAFAHCEIPCGIYGDRARIESLLEDCTTIEKSMTEIVRLGEEAPVNYNQIVRWVTNKDDHANMVQDTVYQYFMSQRIKPVPESEDPAYKKYVKQVTLLHEMLVYAMKCKQTTDLANVEKLRTLISDFEAVYFEPEEHNHEEEVTDEQ